MKRAIISIIVLLVLATVFPLATPAQASFINLPSFSVATTNNMARATDAAYAFSLGNLNQSGDFIKGVKIRVPFGYTGDFSLFRPGVLLGTVNVDGFALEVRATSGTRAVVYWVLGPVRLAVGEVVVGSRVRELVLNVSYQYKATVVQAVLSTVAGLFINPAAPGIYTWRAWVKARNSDFQELTPQDVVIVTPALRTMHVQRIDLSYTQRWPFPFITITTVLGEVTIVDALNRPVAGAAVTAPWTGLTSRIAAGTTDASGKARMSLQLWNRHGLLKLTVTNVTKARCVYDAAANVVTELSIIIP